MTHVLTARTRVWLAAAAPVSPGVLIAAAGSSSAALTDTHCAYVGSGPAVVCTFAPTDNPATFVVPANVALLHLVAQGGAGGDANMKPGGYAAVAERDVVNPSG